MTKVGPNAQVRGSGSGFATSAGPDRYSGTEKTARGTQVGQEYKGPKQARDVKYP